MDSIQTQTFAIRGNDDAVAYIDFCDGDLCVSVVVEGKQADFHFEPVTLKRRNNNERRIYNIRNSEADEK